MILDIELTREYSLTCGCCEGAENDRPGLGNHWLVQPSFGLDLITHTDSLADRCEDKLLTERGVRRHIGRDVDALPTKSNLSRKSLSR